METCPFSLQLSAYHDGELPAEPRRALEQHLQSGCAPCEAELKQWQKLSAVLASAATPLLSQTMREALYHMAPVARDAIFIGVAKWATALAASVVLAVSGWMIFNRQSSQTNLDPQSWTSVALAPSQSADAAADDSQFPDWVVANLAVSGTHD